MSPSISPRAPRNAWQLGAFALACAASLGLLVIPVYRVETVTTTGESTTELLTLSQAEGPGALVLLAVPVMLTLGSLVAPARLVRWTSVATTALLAVAVLLALASIGLFFVPALLVALVATIRLFRGVPER